MDLDEFSDEEDREARMYAMLHYIDSEITQSSVPPNEMISEKVDCNITNKSLGTINIPTTNKSSLIIINCDEPCNFFSNNNENGTENSKNIEKSIQISNTGSVVGNTKSVSISEASESVRVADNSKQTSQIDNLNTGESGKKKISHAGRYWDTSNSETVIKEVNLPYQKVNKPVHKQPPTAPSPDDAVSRRSETLITLTDKRASKRKTSENAASIQNDMPLKSIAAATTTDKRKFVTEPCKVVIETLPILQGLKSQASATITEKRKPVTEPCRVVIETMPILQGLEKGSKKNSPSLLLTQMECMISSKSKKNSPKTPTPTKKSKRILAAEYNVIAADRKKALLLLKNKSSAKKAQSARKENDTFLAEISLKNRYAKTVKNQFSKSIKQDSTVITLDSSDEDDDVIEVELPPIHPATIDLDSSDESLSEETLDIADSETRHAMSTSGTQTEPSDSTCRKDGISPVPSIVSSVSDDFIQGDCSTLNISQGYDTSNLTFNFGLHGTDLCEVPIDITPSKSGKKSKKNSSTSMDTEDIITKSTSALTTLSKSNEGVQLLTESSKETLDPSQTESECFATPRSKIKKRRNSKPKSYTVPDQAYVTPSIDVYESESSDIPESLVDVPITPISKKKRKSLSEKDDTVSSTSTANDVCYIPEDKEDFLIMANVVGLPSHYINSDDDTAYVLDDLSPDGEMVPSTTVIKHCSKTSKTRKKTKLEKCIRQMHKYYDTNWGADFDHIKLKQEMPKDRECWAVDAADRGRPRKVTTTCGFCNKTGHRSEFCYRKPQVCSMCGSTGHRDIKCPNKICLNCGSPNSGFTASCIHCRNWRNAFCEICREYGHPSQKCPDTWRRYHLTITNEIPLIEDKRRKPHSQLFCSGCTKRGHLIINCQNYISFSDFKPASPYVFCYKPVITPDGVRAPPKAPAIIPSLMSIDTKIGSPQSPGRIKSSNVQEILLPKWNKRLGPANVTERNLNIENCLSPMVNKTRSISISDNEKNKVEGLKISFSNTLNGAVSARKVIDLDKISDFPRDESNTLNAGSENPTADSKSKSSDLQRRDLGKDTNLGITNDFQTRVNINLKANDGKIKLVNAKPTDLGDENNTTSHLLLTLDHANKLSNPEGEEFLKYLSDKYKITAKKCILKVGTSLVLAGNAEKHLDFQSDMQSWMNVPVRVGVSLPTNCIPKNRNAAIYTVLTDIQLLKTNLGNPIYLYQSIQDTEKIIVKTGSKGNVNGIKYLRLCKKLNNLRRSLNMILIGQAGFCDGAETLNKLNLLVNDLKRKVYQDLDSEMRDKISECYESVFSTAPRDDYPQLIEQYVSNTRAAIQASSTILKASHTKKQRSLLTRIRIVIEKLLKAGNVHKHKKNKQLGVNCEFLLKCENKILTESLSTWEFQNIRNAILNADNYIATLKLKKKKKKKKTKQNS